METIQKNTGGFVINSQEEKTDQCSIQGEGNGKPTPLRMLPSISPRITRSLTDSKDINIHEAERLDGR